MQVDFHYMYYSTNKVFNISILSCNMSPYSGRVVVTLDNFSIPFLGALWSLAQHGSPKSCSAVRNSSLVDSHDYQGEGYEYPIHAIRYDGSNSGRILPTEDGVEDSPPPF